MRGGEVAAAVVCRAMRCGATLGGGGGGRGWVARVREGADGCMETGAHGRWGAAGPAVARHICLYVQTGGVVVCTRWESPLSRRWVAGFACFAGGEAAYSPSVVGCVRPGVFFSSRSLLRARMACGASGRRGPSGVPQALSSACQRSGDGRAVVLRGESCRWLGGGRGGEVVLAAAGQGRPRWRLLFLPCHCVLFFLVVVACRGDEPVALVGEESRRTHRRRVWTHLRAQVVHAARAQLVHAARAELALRDPLLCTRSTTS